MRLGGLLLAVALPFALQGAGLDVVLRIDAPRGLAPDLKPPFQVEVAFVLEDPAPRQPNGLRTFTGRCAWDKPAAALAYRWPGALVLQGPALPRGRTLKALRYTIRDRDGRRVADYSPRDPGPRLHTESLSALILHLRPGVLGQPGAAMEHRLELEF